MIDITSSTRIPDIETQKPTIVGANGAYTTTTKEELESTTPIPSISTIPTAANNQESSMSTIVPKIEKEEEEELMQLEKQPTQPPLMQKIPTRIESQQPIKRELEEGKKRSRFGGFFRRKNKEKKGGREEEIEETKLQKSVRVEKQTEDKESKKQKEGSKDANTQEKDNVVYLSDEEIDDLLK